MRKNSFLCIVLAAAAMTILSCQKVENSEPQVLETHTVSFILGDANATKTEINGTGTAAQWTAGDAANFKVWENTTEGTSINLNTTSGVLTATFEGTPTAAEYVYKANMAGDRTNSGQPRVPVAQTSSANSFDPNADILVAQEQTFDSTQGSLTMSFARPVVINKMTLKGLGVGETISTVLISSDVKITGYYDVDGKEWHEQYNEITVTVDQLVPANGQIDVFFITKPVVGATLTITANSATNTYSKTFGSTIDFLENKFTRFSVSGLTPTPKSNYSGEYLLTNVAVTKMAKPWVSDNTSIYSTDVTLEGGVVYYNPDDVTIDDAKLTITKITDSESAYYGMYTIQQNGKYLYPAASGGNQLKAKAELDVNTYWDISYSADTWSIVATKSSNRNVMRFNSSNSAFNCYASATQAAVNLQAVSVKPTPVITATNVEIESTAVSSPTSVGATFNSNTSSVDAVAYDDSGLTAASTWLTASVEGTVVKYTATANETGASRIAYIKITATNSEARSVVKTITVTQAAAGAAYYQKVANKAAITLGDKYLVVAHGYAMAHPATGSSSTLAGTSVTINDDKINKTDALEALEFTITAGPSGTYNATPYDYTSGYYMFGFVSGTETVYMYSVADNSTKFRASKNPVYNGNATGVWTIAEGVTGYAGGTFKIENVAYAAANRVILCNNSTFGYYANTNTSYYLIDLYKLVEP